jgi:regulator of protease activity HflC (stomatin/prohibitin superfamily)
VSSRIREALLKRANEFNIELEDVSITHMTFGKEFTRAVEQKQIAQQDAERARFTVEKVSHFIIREHQADRNRPNKNVKQMLFVLKERLNRLI